MYNYLCESVILPWNMRNTTLMMGITNDISNSKCKVDKRRGEKRRIHVFFGEKLCVECYCRVNGYSKSTYYALRKKMVENHTNVVVHGNNGGFGQGKGVKGAMVASALQSMVGRVGQYMPHKQQTHLPHASKHELHEYLSLQPVCICHSISLGTHTITVMTKYDYICCC